jgi:hypothetical protein
MQLYCLFQACGCLNLIKTWLVLHLKLHKKTLTHFLISGDSSRKSNSDNSSLGSIVDSHEICSYEDRDLLDDNHLPDLEDNHTIMNNAGGVEKTYEPFKNGNCKQGM